MGFERQPNRGRRRPAIALALTLLLAGCAAGSSVPPALDEANAAVERARSSPPVRALAPAELDLAEVALEQAGAAARAGAPRAQVEHLAYVASQRAALAETRAAAEVARAEARLLRRSLDQADLVRAAGERRLRSSFQQSAQSRAPRAKPDRQNAPERERVEVPADPAPVAAADAAVAAEAAPDAREVVLRLAELPSGNPGPIDPASGQLSALAERLLGDPRLSLVIEAEFDLPNPEERTVMEQRVEAVRAFFLERGVAPARLLVRAGDDVQPQPAAATLVEPSGSAQLNH